MVRESQEPDTDLTYQLDEAPPATVAAGIGIQYAVLFLGSMILNTVIVFRAAGAADDAIAWVVFISLLIGGAITVLHAFPLGRLGGGHVLVTGSTAAAIAISVDALELGGPGLLATLMVASALFQFLFSMRLSLFRRILTPTVSGTIILLIPVTVMPIILGRLDDVPSGSSASTALACALATIVLLAGFSFRGTRTLRPWAPVIGLVGGALVGGFLGLYDLGRVASAPWIGVPSPEWPTLEPQLGPSFWSLLPAFLLVSLSCTVRTVGASLAIQSVSWRRRRATDFRAVQGALAADALGNLLAGLAGTMMIAVRSTTVSLTQMTRVASRRIGVVLGAAIVVVAFLPKIIALILALPGPVLAAYLAVVLGGLFIIGMRMVVSQGLDHRQALIAGLSFWVGAGCQYGFIFPEQVAAFAGGLLKSGITAGGLCAIVITVVLELTSPRRRRFRAELDIAALEGLYRFVEELVDASKWGPAMAARLKAASEETLLTLLENATDGSERRPRLLVTARRDGRAAVLEFVSASGDGNIEDRIAVLGDSTSAESIGQDVSLRLLRHMASEVRHRQYHDAHFVTVRVENPEAGGEGS